MLTSALLLVVFACVRLVGGYEGFLVGTGRWLVLNINTCENPEQYEIKLDIIRKKINRTHDGFDMTMEFDKDIDFTYGLEIEIYQVLDGGLKYRETIFNNCICKYLMMVARKNVEKGFILAHIDPPHCPVPKGITKVNNFVMDYRELPRIGLYGTFACNMYITYDKKRMACVHVLVNFEIRNDDASEEDDVVDSVLSPVKSFVPGF